MVNSSIVITTFNLETNARLIILTYFGYAIHKPFPYLQGCRYQDNNENVELSYNDQ